MSSTSSNQWHPESTEGLMPGSWECTDNPKITIIGAGDLDADNSTNNPPRPPSPFFSFLGMPWIGKKSSRPITTLETASWRPEGECSTRTPQLHAPTRGSGVNTQGQKRHSFSSYECGDAASLQGPVGNGVSMGTSGLLKHKTSAKPEHSPPFACEDGPLHASFGAHNTKRQLSPRPKRNTLTEFTELDIDCLGDSGYPMPKTWGDLVKQLAPLPPFLAAIECLQGIFSATDAIRVNKAHWRGLRSQCVFTSLVVAFQYQKYQGDEEKRKFITGVCDGVASTIADIERSALKWKNKSLLVAFADYEKMSDDISLNIQRLEASRRALKTSSQVMCESLTMEVVAMQKTEWNEIKRLHEIVKQQTNALDQLKQQMVLSDQRTKEFEMEVKDVLQREMLKLNKSTGDKGDVQKTIRFIESLTGVQLPMEVFHETVCTNVSQEPISRTQTCTVYKATFVGGQLVAKKLLEIGKYSENDVKTYAEKVCRDVQQWQKFDSKYTLRCLGIGMERFGENAFKMYMVSPLIENMDAMSYLKNRRGFQDNKVLLEIGKPAILRILYGAALGLIEVHRHDSVHSNMRGENVLVGSDGMGILGGFGLTKSLQTQDTIMLPAIEQTGVNPPYRWMAPECVNPSKGKPEVTQANDVWGWAMTALQIITGVPPIREITNDMYLYSDQSHFILKRQDYPEFELFAHQPNELWSLMADCWKLDPEERPTMKTVTGRLENILLLSC